MPLVFHIHMKDPETRLLRKNIAQTSVPGISNQLCCKKIPLSRQSCLETVWCIECIFITIFSLYFSGISDLVLNLIKCGRYVVRMMSQAPVVPLSESQRKVPVCYLCTLSHSFCEMCVVNQALTKTPHPQHTEVHHVVGIGLTGGSVLESPLVS